MMGCKALFWWYGEQRNSIQRDAFVLDAFFQCLHQPRFADAGFPTQQHDLARLLL